MKKTRSTNSCSESVADSQGKSKGPGSDPRLLVNIFGHKKSQKFLIESVVTDMLDDSSDYVEITLKTTMGDFCFWVTTNHNQKNGAILLTPGPMIVIGDF